MTDLELLARIDERTKAIQEDIAVFKKNIDELYEGRNDNKSRLDKLETEHKDRLLVGCPPGVTPDEPTPWYKSQRTRDTATGGGIVGIVLLIVQFLIDYLTKAP
jgi:hypothetical protein